MLRFKYSWIYDQTWRGFAKAGNFGTYPSSAEVRGYIEKIKSIWCPIEEDIALEISSIANLKWKEQQIICYVVGRCRPISEPLTIMVFESDQELVSTLIHELIHQIISQNGKEYDKASEFIRNRYRDESQVTLNHIFLFAVYAKMHIRIFGEEDLKKHIAKTVRPEYARAWEIANGEGYDSLIEKFTSELAVNSGNGNN
ncbi:MAG: hypothetical protein KGH65_03250 [Candidatus Micrarchaeota archaeon]|nr:hypothetical protein [Candidatus Micrarchaeota archaeon]